MQPFWPAPAEVRIWLIAAGSRPPGFEGDDALRVLSIEERARGERFRDASSREQFLTGRTYLRVLLAACLDVTPGEVAIRTDPAGKPRLGAGQAASHGLHFSVSHSGDLVAIALAASGPVGIDVEQIRTFRDLEAVARTVLSEGEHRLLSRLPAELRSEAFFGAWTRKEAVLKAMGTGLGYPVDQVEVGTGPEAVTVVLDPDEATAGEGLSWTVESLTAVPRGYRAAAASAGNSIRLRLAVVGAAPVSSSP